MRREPLNPKAWLTWACARCTACTTVCLAGETFHPLLFILDLSDHWMGQERISATEHKPMISLWIFFVAMLGWVFYLVLQSEFDRSTYIRLGTCLFRNNYLFLFAGQTVSKLWSSTLVRNSTYSTSLARLLNRHRFVPIPLCLSVSGCSVPITPFFSLTVFFPLCRTGWNVCTRSAVTLGNPPSPLPTRGSDRYKHWQYQSNAVCIVHFGKCICHKCMHSKSNS